MIYKAIKVKLYPTVKQRALLDKHFDACRFVYNLALEYKITMYRDYKISVSKYDIMKQLTDVKHESSVSWLYDVKNESLQSAILNVDAAYKNFFRGNGFPRFKSKKDKQSFTQTQTLKILSNTNKIVLLKNKIKFRCSDSDKELLNSRKLRNITYSKNKINQYFASILIEDNIKTLEPVEAEIGIDLGLKHFAVTSNGEVIENPKYFKKSEKKLKKFSKWHSRKKKGSNNKEKARYKLAKLYQKITNQRNHFLNVLSHRLINENQVIHLETLDIKKMQQNKTLAKGILDVSWNRFVGMLKYKAAWHGKKVQQIGKFIPSSKTCSNCGIIKQNLTLVDRVFCCDVCGHIEDRDLNAAKNILKFSRDELTRINAYGEKDNSHSLK